MLVVQRFANETGEAIPITSQTLPKQLKTKGQLVSTDEARGTLNIRRRLEGQDRKVLHVKCFGARENLPTSAFQK